MTPRGYTVNVGGSLVRVSEKKICLHLIGYESIGTSLSQLVISTADIDMVCVVLARLLYFSMPLFAAQAPFSHDFLFFLFLI